MKEALFSQATVLTPNIPEAEVLAGQAITDASGMEEAARTIGSRYSCAVLCKGGHQVNDADDLLWYDGRLRWFHGARIQTANTHGTGCTLSSAIASNLAKGLSLEQSVEQAKAYISGALGAMLDLGRGSGPVNHLFPWEGDLWMSELIAGIFTSVVLGSMIWLCHGSRLTTRDICLAGLMATGTLILRSLLITLPNGSHISLGGMIPILCLSLVHCTRTAFCAGWAAGLLAALFLPGWQPIHWAQPFVEHLVCFSSLGFAGIFGYDRRWKVAAGTTLAVAISVTSHIMAGAVFFANYAWDGYGPWAYSILANLSGHGVEGLITIFLVSFLPIKQLRRVTKAGI